MLPIKLGEERYAVLAVQGHTTCFELPSNFSRDEVTEKVNYEIN